MPRSNQKDLTSFFEIKEKRDQNSSHFELCPICYNSFPRHCVQTHVQQCIYKDKKEEQDSQMYLSSTIQKDIHVVVTSDSKGIHNNCQKFFKNESTSPDLSLNKNNTYPKAVTDTDNISHEKSHSMEECRKQQGTSLSPTKNAKIHDVKINICDTKTSHFELCPICWNSFPRHLVQNHVEHCINNDLKEEQDPVNSLHSTINEDNHVVTSVSNNIPNIQKESIDSKHQSPMSTLPPSNYENNHANKADHETSHQKPTFGKCRKQWDSLSPSSKKAKLQEHETDNLKNYLSHTEEPIPGLFLYENFITNEEEELIISALDTEKNNPWKYTRFNGSSMGKRWGVHCNLRDRRVDMPQIPLPSFIHELLLPKLKSINPSIMKGCIPNEANAIDYQKKAGHYLRHHVDDRYLSKEPIANLSLAGSCYMTFILEKQNKFNDNPVPPQKKVLLRPKTLLVMTGKARYDYSHGIYYKDLLSGRRVSITMRESPLSNRNNCKITECFQQL